MSAIISTLPFVVRHITRRTTAKSKSRYDHTTSAFNPPPRFSTSSSRAWIQSQYSFDPPRTAIGACPAAEAVDPGAPGMNPFPVIATPMGRPLIFTFFLSLCLSLTKGVL
jgi:hypothetical protein